MPGSVVIVDYGMGNLHSVSKRVRRLGVEWCVSSSPEEIKNANKLILPGVGHFGKAMGNLRSRGLVEPLNEAVGNVGVPILGICLGMQLMTESSEEGDCPGLGWFKAKVHRFQIKDELNYKVPHIGWNQIKKMKRTPLDVGIADNSEFYFVHSFHVECEDESDRLHQTTYECSFTSAIQKENMFGVQYHPEKSHDLGIQMLKNFLEIAN